ncbi:MAG: DNA translocase FtsK 4TM domain-containing protein [Syntrophobacteraceae bacterium]
MDRKKHEIWALCLLTISLLVAFSILSYHEKDPTIFFPSTDFTSNWVGAFGANIAWPLITFLGLGAYGLVIAGLWASWRLYREPVIERMWFRLLGIALLIVSSMTLGAMHWEEVPFLGQEFKIGAGGEIGGILAKFLHDRLSALGSHTLLIGMFLIALLLSTPLTLKAMLQGISAFWGKTSDWLLGNSGAEQGGQPESESLDAPPDRVTKKQRLPLPTVQTELFQKRQPRSGSISMASPPVHPGQYWLPDLTLLDTYETDIAKPDWKRLEQNGAVLEEKLADFGVQGKVVGINPGPVITMYEYAPAPGIKISRIAGLADDLSMALKAISVRVVAAIPGKAAVGIEIPNLKRELVSLKAVLESEIFSLAVAPLTIALGKDITGQPFVTNLGRMPHLLIAGATGTGKSVCINTILISLLFRNTPEELRLLLIDPKRIELNSFEGLPHLIHPVVTDAKMATRALRWAVEEMERRYKMLADKNVRNIEAYNRELAREKPQKGKEVEKQLETGELSDAGLQHYRLPYVVIIIDELADLMMVASREVEESITRLAQMARAAGIHLVLATQRPSVDVLTGIIKANISTRISFQVSSKIDSRTILDGSGAEALLGAGDMLFQPPGTAKLQRIHGAFVSDAEIVRLTEHWKSQKLFDDPLKGRVDLREEAAAGEIAQEELDEKYEDAVQLVMETRQASISMLQRRLRVGYNRAARMIEVMEQQGIVSPSDGIKPREVLGRRLS